MMRSFDIHPYLGALPIIFGLTRAEVHALLGVPQVSSPPTPWRGISDSWEGGNPSIGYDEKETVTHIGFGPGDFSLLLSGSPLWSASEHPDPNPALLRLDPNPVEALGFLMFDRIGVTTTGYHDDDEDDLAITVYPRGAKDKFLKKAKVPDLGRYLRVT
jgi:hypothetical protein